MLGDALGVTKAIWRNSKNGTIGQKKGLSSRPIVNMGTIHCIKIGGSN